ncbi:MAG: hypothetical protein AAFV90_30185 [Cyanobacteria bacterium J06634_5]
MSSLYQKFNDLSKGKLAQQVDSTPGGALSRGSQSGAIQNSSKAALRTQASSGGAISAAQRDPLSKPLLHILDYGEKPGDLAISSRHTGLNGQTDVYITRAEMELKKAMQSLAFMTNSEINSVTTMTAMSLPKAVTPLFWTIRALLQEKYQKPNDRNRIHHRNQDARLLFQQLARLNLRHWSNHLVGYIHADEMPDNLMFPLGHPVRGKTYRRHPFKTRWNSYFPVTDYFSLLYEERERALLALLGDLGATKITMTAIPSTSEIDCQAAMAAQLRQKVFSYPKSDRPLPTSIDLQRHPWLAGESAWQEMVRERLERRALSAQFEFDSDVMGMLKAQLKMIGQLVPGLSSMQLPDNYEDQMRSQVLKTRQVKVEFCEAPFASPLPQ